MKVFAFIDGIFSKALDVDSLFIEKKIRRELGLGWDCNGKIILLIEDIKTEIKLDDWRNIEAWWQFDNYRHNHTNYDYLTQFNNYNSVIEYYTKAIISIYPEWKNIAERWAKIKEAEK